MKGVDPDKVSFYSSSVSEVIFAAYVTMKVNFVVVLAAAIPCVAFLSCGEGGTQPEVFGIEISPNK